MVPGHVARWRIVPVYEHNGLAGSMNSLVNVKRQQIP